MNDFTHKWPEGEQAAKVIFEALAEAGVDYIHVTEFEAWQPAFANSKDTLAKILDSIDDLQPRLFWISPRDPCINVADSADDRGSVTETAKEKAL